MDAVDRKLLNLIQEVRLYFFGKYFTLLIFLKSES